MADVISVPANEGISVKNENDDPEINAMALKMKENFQKSASVTLRQQGLINNNTYINRNGKPVPRPITTVSPSNLTLKESIEKPSNDCEDIYSIKGSFSWEEIGATPIPYITRVINNEKLEFVSVRVAESQLLMKFLNFLHADIYTCTSVRSHFITEAEAKLLNEINVKHSDSIYGKEPFNASKDYIVRLEDVIEFYAFLDVCYNKLLCIPQSEGTPKCGFIRINSESVVPYCLKDNQKYVPLFYFEGETENLRHRAVKLENWNLAYLKFCCKVQGIRNELFASDSCVVTSLDDIKNYFPPDTNFEEYWPAKVVDTQLLTNQKTSHIYPPGAWIRAPPAALNKVPTSENILPHSLTAPTPVVPPLSMPITNNGTYQNGWSANQMVNSYSAQAQSPSTRYSAVSRIPNVAAQYYNASGAIVQQNNSSMNTVGHIPPPPLVRAGSSPAVNNPASYSNMAFNNNPLTNQIRQFYGNNPRSNNGNQVQVQQQQQQQINSSLVQQAYGTHVPVNSSNARVTNTQQRNALRNIAAAVTTQASEIIDLSSPPSSPTPQNVQSNNGWELKRIPDRPWGHDTSNNVAYKIQRATLQGKTIHCINAKPYIYSDLMVTLDDLVQTIFPTSTTAKCAHILQKYLKIILYSGNSEQLQMLRENGRLRSLFPDEIPLVMLQDVTQVLPQLKNLLSKQEDQINQYQTSIASKRQRMS